MRTRLPELSDDFTPKPLPEKLRRNPDETARDDERFADA